MKRLSLLLALVLAAPMFWPGEAEADIRQSSGKVTFLRVHEVGTRWGPPADQIDVEVVIRLDSQPGMAFGFQLRDDRNRPVRQGKLDLLRDAFSHGWTVTIDYDIQPGKNNGVIIRTALTRPATTGPTVVAPVFRQ